MAKRSAFDTVVRDCDGVIHVASVTTPSSDPNEVITPSIAGAINALEAASHEDGVQRFVYCSSITAAVSPTHRTSTGLTSESWNMLDFDEAWAPPPCDRFRVAAVQASSKMQAEAAIWRWYGRVKPHFVLNTGRSSKYVLSETCNSAQSADKNYSPAG
jgi:nucleoside-diphosphate-sugar epimerase